MRTKFSSQAFVFSLLAALALNAHARVRIPSSWGPFEVALAIAGVAAVVWAIGVPGRALGKHLHDVGSKEGSRWKADLGAALYGYAFHLMVAILALIFLVIPNL